MALVTIVACGTSKVADDATVTVKGRLSLPDGAPAAGITVGLMKQPGAFDALAEIGLTVTTVGLACLTRKVSICQGARKATTDSDGRFSFTMSGQDSKSTLGNPSDFLVSAQLAAKDGELAGPSVQTRFAIDAETVEVAPMRFWRPGSLVLRPGPATIAYAFDAIDVPKPRYSVTIEDRDGNPVWVHGSAGRDGDLDARAGADVQGGFFVAAAASQADHGVTFLETYFSQHLAFTGVAGAPTSRHRPCAVASSAGQARFGTECVLTDGVYREAYPAQTCPAASPSPSGEPCAANTWAWVDLGSPRPVGAVFLHGLGLSGGNAVIDTSDDGTTWSVRSQVKTDAYLRVPLNRVVARYLRVRGGVERDTIGRLAEIAVWP
jgi:hypothetical protein